MRLITAAVAALILPAVAHAEWTLTTADFKETPRVTVNEFSLKEGLSVSSDAGQLKRTPAREVVSLVSTTPRVEGAGKWVLTLRNGDVLTGMLADSPDTGIVLTLPDAGEVQVPTKFIATVALKGTKAGKTPVGTKDVVRFKNGDSEQGDYLGIKDEKLSISTDNGEAALAIDRVDRLTFAGITPARKLPPLSARVTFIGGSMLTVGELSWSINNVTFKDPAGKERKTSADQIASVEILGGRTVFLTDMDPVKDEQTPTLGSPWPTQINRNVLGQPLKVARQVFARGLGVHSKSVLTYDLGGEFETLTLRAGLDDSSAPYGEANLSVMLDGKVLWEKKSAKAGQLSEVLSLPVKGGKQLQLRAEPAGRLDVQGRVNWVNVAVVRP